MSERKLRRLVAVVCAISALASCDALVGISDTSASNGGTGGVDASAGAGGTAGGDASADATPDVIGDATSDHSVGPLPSHGLGCALWPDDKPVTVGCPGGQVIKGFSTVLYGNPTGACDGADGGPDAGGSFQPGTCNATGAKAAIEALCDGLPSCTFKAGDNLQAFAGDAGDPCPGTRKFIALQVECGTAPVQEGGSEAGAPALPATGQMLDLDAESFKHNVVGDPLPNNVWNDSSPNQLNATVPSGVDTPTVALDQTTGKGLVRFSGNNQYLVLSKITEDLSNGLTAFAVVAPLHDHAWQRIFDFSNGSPMDNIVLTQAAGPQPLDFQIDVGMQGSSFAAPDAFRTDQLELFSVRAEPAPAVGGSLQKATMYKGGAPIFEQFMPAPNDVTRKKNRIGMSAWDTNTPFDGYMAQLVVYNRALSDPEMDSAHEALMQSWKLCANTDTQTDPANCGYCGHLCSPGQKCNAGVCEGPLLTECDAIDLGDTSHYYALCHPGKAKVSWVQARNACTRLGGDLISVHDAVMSNTVAGAAGGPVLVGMTDFGISSFYWTDGSSASFNAWTTDAGAPPTATRSCAEIVSGSNWQPVSCTTPRNVPWICTLPSPSSDKGNCKKYLEPQSQRAWDICDGKPPGYLLRRAVCESVNGAPLTVKDQNDASLVAPFLVRYDGDLPAAAIDLTDGVSPLSWTLFSGANAPFAGWAQGEPSVGEEPRCGRLAPDGTMVAAPCNGQPQPVLCGLPDGTAPDQTLTGAPFFVGLEGPLGTMDASLTVAGSNTNVGGGFHPGASIPVGVKTDCLFTQGTEKAKLFVSPGAGSTCATITCTFGGQGSNQTSPATLTAPSVAGVYDIAIAGANDDQCNSLVQQPQLFGRIAVAPK